MENMTSTLGATTKLPELLQEWKRSCESVSKGISSQREIEIGLGSSVRCESTHLCFRIGDYGYRIGQSDVVR
eukprot:1391218-Amorphochlora_amoeboformis.AAC.1